jgi:hypothetical protein
MDKVDKNSAFWKLLVWGLLLLSFSVSSVVLLRKIKEEQELGM